MEEAKGRLERAIQLDKADRGLALGLKPQALAGLDRRAWVALKFKCTRGTTRVGKSY